MDVAKVEKDEPFDDVSTSMLRGLFSLFAYLS
jgi:hypothetical protein